MAKSKVVFSYCLHLVCVLSQLFGKAIEKKQKEYLRKYCPVSFGFVIKEMCMPTLVRS